MAVKHKTCSKCGRTLNENEFFKMRTGERCDLCKDCLCQYIDNRKPETFLWILEKFNVPYIEQKWVTLTNEKYKKDPGKFGPKSVIGFYLRAMNMTQYQDYTFADSDQFNKPKLEEQPSEEDAADYEAKLKAQLESGEISEGQYNTLTRTNMYPQGLDEKGFIKDIGQEQPAEETSEETPFYQVDSSYWTDQLDESDIDYLMLKWGTMYTPEQWIKMETMYSKYSQEYELNVDREEVLKKMCKTSLKMDECLDAGDVTAYKNLAAVFDQLRKSGKFTEAQNKDDRQQILSSIGELVALCEQEGGIIPNLPQFDPDEYPQDKIDFTLKDLKAYTRNLAVNELGLSDLIESYIEKLEHSENDAADVNTGLITSLEEEEANALTDAEVEDWGIFLENEIEAEAEMLEKFLSGEVFLENES